jgi:hypothetical protein
MYVPEMPNLRIPLLRAVPRRRILGPASSIVICLLSSVSTKLVELRD